MDWNQLFTDFRQRYEKCYCSVLLEGYKQPQIFFLDFVEQTKHAPLLHLRNDEVGEVILKYDDSYSDLTFKLPAIGLYNNLGTVVMVRRAYGRQFKKGICNGTIAISSIYEFIYSGWVWGPEKQLNESLVKVLFKPETTLSLMDGINALDKKLAVALSHEFAIGLSSKQEKSFILWYYENPIGMVDPQSNRIFLREPQFQQEFQDFVAKIQGTHDFTLLS